MSFVDRKYVILVCDGCSEEFETTAESEAEVLREAGESDWSIGRDGKHYCDGCPGMGQGPVFIRACPPRKGSAVKATPGGER